MTFAFLQTGTKHDACEHEPIISLTSNLMPQNYPNSFEADMADDRESWRDVAMTESIQIFIVTATPL